MNEAENPTDTPEANVDRRRTRRKREIALAVVGVVSGFVVLPFLIFIVGTVLLGPYAGGKSAGAFFADFYTHLTQGTPRTWFIVLAPYAAIWAVRLCIKPWSFPRSKASPPPTDDAVESPARRNAPPARREPFIGA